MYKLIFKIGDGSLPDSETEAHIIIFKNKYYLSILKHLIFNV